MAAVHEDDLITADIGEWRSYVSRPITTSADEMTSTAPTLDVSSIPRTSMEDERTRTSTTPTPTTSSHEDQKPATSSTPPPPPPESTSTNDDPASKAPAPLPSPDASNTTPSTLETTTQTTSLASPSASSSSPALAPLPPSSTPTIAGAAAGGTAFLAVALGALFYLLRRRKRSQSKASTTQHWNPDVGVGRPTLPDISGVYEKEGNGLERYANPTRGVSMGHVHQATMQQSSLQHGSMQHQASTERVKFNGSPYPELGTTYAEQGTLHHELESPQPQPHVSPQQSWNGAIEVHAERKSPVSELEGMGPIVRMEGENTRGRYYAGTNF